MRTKAWVLAATAAWMLTLTAPHGARARFLPTPTDPKDHFSIAGSDPWVPDDRQPARIAATPSQAVVDSGRDVTLLRREVRTVLLWERILRILRIGGIVR